MSELDPGLRAGPIAPIGPIGSGRSGGSGGSGDPGGATQAAIEADPGRVDAALVRHPRSRHLPPGQRRYAALDRPLPIGHGQTNSQPSTVRTMLLALDVRPGHRVLDVGSGSAWTTVLLADLASPGGSVLGVERIPELVTVGRAALALAGMPSARIHTADADRLGAAVYGPFDRILVSAMAAEVRANSSSNCPRAESW